MQYEVEIVHPSFHILFKFEELSLSQSIQTGDKRC